MKIEKFLDNCDQDMKMCIHLLFKNNYNPQEKYYKGITNLWDEIKEKIILEYNKKYGIKPTQYQSETEN